MHYEVITHNTNVFDAPFRQNRQDSLIISNVQF